MSQSKKARTTTDSRYVFISYPDVFRDICTNIEARRELCLRMPDDYIDTLVRMRSFFSSVIADKQPSDQSREATADLFLVFVTRLATLPEQCKVLSLFPRYQHTLEDLARAMIANGNVDPLIDSRNPVLLRALETALEFTRISLDNSINVRMVRSIQESTSAVVVCKPPGDSDFSHITESWIPLLLDLAEHDRLHVSPESEVDIGACQENGTIFALTALVSRYAGSREFVSDMLASRPCVLATMTKTLGRQRQMKETVDEQRLLFNEHGEIVVDTITKLCETLQRWWTSSSSTDNYMNSLISSMEHLQLCHHSADMACFNIGRLVCTTESYLRTRLFDTAIALQQSLILLTGRQDGIFPHEVMVQILHLAGDEYITEALEKSTFESNERITVRSIVSRACRACVAVYQAAPRRRVALATRYSAILPRSTPIIVRVASAVEPATDAVEHQFKRARHSRPASD